MQPPTKDKAECVAKGSLAPDEASREDDLCRTIDVGSSDPCRCNRDPQVLRIRQLLFLLIHFIYLLLY